jgi:hypothetical protein
VFLCRALRRGFDLENGQRLLDGVALDRPQHVVLGDHRLWVAGRRTSRHDESHFLFGRVGDDGLCIRHDHVLRSDVGIQRTTGYANGTTNAFYAVSDGFVALDTFRKNVANYTNTTISYPTLSIAFGAVAVPEPATCASLRAGLGLTGIVVWRRRQSG